MNPAASHLKVDPARCTGCGRCVAACPERLFSLEPSGYRKYAVMTTPERCSRCLRCLAECPVGAITELFP
jgi:ferredoxin